MALFETPLRSTGEGVYFLLYAVKRNKRDDFSGAVQKYNGA